MLKITPLTIRRLVGNGKLMACKVGRVLRFRSFDAETSYQLSKSKMSSINRDIIIINKSVINVNE